MLIKRVSKLVLVQLTSVGQVSWMQRSQIVTDTQMFPFHFFPKDLEMQEKKALQVALEKAETMVWNGLLLRWIVGAVDR